MSKHCTCQHHQTICRTRCTHEVITTKANKIIIDGDIDGSDGDDDGDDYDGEMMPMMMTMVMTMVVMMMVKWLW